MLTEKQKEQGERAVLGLLHEDFVKHRALKRHKRALEVWKMYGIPYKCTLDYLKKDLQDVVLLNDCYPLPGYPKDVKKIIVHVPQDTLPNELTPNEEKQAEINEYARQFIKYQRFDEEWKYRFLHFLDNYDFSLFTAFDFTGMNEDISLSDLNLLRNVYTRLQAEYKSNPTDYINTEPVYLDEYKEQYTSTLYELVMDNKTKQERKVRSREQKEAQELRLFEMKQQKRKEKHRGH